jgi:TolA-binding protein
MKTIDFSYFIERYNAGEMDHIEKKWFEKELNGNESLQSEVKFRKKVDDALVKHDIIALRNKLAVLEKTRKEKAVAASGKKAVGLRYAAAVAALMLLGSLLIFTSGTKVRDRLYGVNFQTYNANSNSRALDAENNITFSIALKLYDEMDYAGAAIKFRDYLKTRPQDMQAQLIYGVSEMKNYNYPDAKSAFRSVIRNNDNLYIDAAQWYLALCTLKTSDKSEALTQFEAIASSKSIYNTRARKIIKKIK